MSRGRQQQSMHREMEQAVDRWVRVHDRYVCICSFFSIRFVFNHNQICSVSLGGTEWDSTSAHGQAYAIIEDADVPFLTMNTNACEHTTCPITKSTRHTYTYSLTVASKTPTVSSIRRPMKWEFHWKKTYRAKCWLHFHQINDFHLICVPFHSLPLCPQKQYTVKWVLRNPDEPENSEQQCCFMTKVRLQKR